MKNTPLKKCPTGKRMFRDEIAAGVALARIERVDDATREEQPQRFYRCEFCHRVHLTSQPKRAGLVSSGTAYRGPQQETGFTSAQRLKIRARAGWGDVNDARCEACGIWLGRYGGQVQHRAARKMGGSRLRNVLPNGALLCGTSATGDHGRAERRDPQLHADGFWLEEGQDPRLVPIMLPYTDGGLPTWLTDDGEYAAECPLKEAA